MKYLSQIQVLGDSILEGIQVNPINKKYYTKNEIDFALLSRRFQLIIQNNSRFGCTVTKGSRLLERMLLKGLHTDAVVMDFGGNDCNYKWSDIALNPDGEFEPTTPLPDFIKNYKHIIHVLKKHDIVPILTTLPPLEPQRFFDWWCQNLNQKNIMKWLGSITEIYSQQEKYSNQVAIIATEENVPLIDIRAAFLSHGHIGDLMCEDGTHPNSNGQRIITQAFLSFAEKYQQSPNVIAV